MRGDVQARICGGPGWATTQVYPAQTRDVQARICGGPGWATTQVYPAQRGVTPKRRKEADPKEAHKQAHDPKECKEAKECAKRRTPKRRRGGPQRGEEAFVDMNEEGTKVATTTGVVMVARAAMIPTDHPFLFLIVDNRTKSLFQKPYAVVRLRGRLYRNRSRYFAPVSRRSIN